MIDLPCQICNTFPFTNRPTAMCTGVLKSLGINHVVNAAYSNSKREGFEVLEEFDPFVRTTEAYYRRAGIRFFPVPAIDLIHFRLAPFFRDAADFIDEALASGGELIPAYSNLKRQTNRNVLVQCVARLTFVVLKCTVP